MSILPQLTECVKPALMPLGLKKQILDEVLGQTEAVGSGVIGNGVVTPPGEPNLPADAKVREVLENGGFLFVKRERTGEIWEYRRAGRDGGPLTGKEAKHPPVYRLVVWGTMTLRCSCPARPAASAPCKHQDALAWSLGLPARKGVLP